MKVLFVLSGNKDKSSGLVVNQARSIMRYNNSIDIGYYHVKGKGIKGYLKNIRPLRAKIREYDPQIIHAHYSFCGFLSALTLTRKPIITSLMGSDLHLKTHWRFMLFVASAFWRSVIVKSSAMKKKYLLSRTCIIPNGVSFDKYEEVSRQNARKALGLLPDKKYVLFLADPERPEKNFRLTKQAFDRLNFPDAELLVVHDVPHETTRLYYYATDILVLSSLYEGSPNVIKEAMVCNCVIVSTEVGDVGTLFEGVDGNYIAAPDTSDFSDKMKQALLFSEEKGRTRGRDKIRALRIDADSIAEKIVELYHTVIN
ncbi:MAG: glycosyltransferase family 4 protein [Bacteroidia bacterium]|nr:glycosyltransferase family 4 protein [Bacteroidia bacterium]